MKKYFLLFILFHSFILSAQPPAVEWQKTYGGDNQDVMNNILKTTDNGFLFSGWSKSYISGDKTVDTFGNSDYWVIKTNSLGNIEWQRTFGGNGLDSSVIIINTSDGGYLISGNSNSDISGNKTENSKGFDDYWILKLDSLGNIQWQKTIGGNANDDFPEVIETPDMGFIIAGLSYSGISGDKSETQIRLSIFDPGQPDYWVVKISSTGIIEWENTIGTIGADVAVSVLNAYNGGYIIGGYSDGNISFDKTEDSKGGNDIWVMKLDTTGAIVWQKTIGGNDKDELRNMISTPDGGYLLSAISNSNISSDKTENSKGGDDFWLVKIDPQGNILWDKTIGGSGTDDPYQICYKNDNHIYVGGNSDSNISDDKTENSRGGRDFWIMKIDSTANILWDKTLGGSESDSNYAMFYNPSDGSLLLGGPSRSNISGDKTENSRGLSDYWIVKLEPESLSTISFTSTNIRVYPNPTTKTITVSFPKNYTNLNVAVTNMLGQKVKQEQFGNASEIRFDLIGENGVYFVEVRNENKEKVVFKVVKE